MHGYTHNHDNNNNIIMYPKLPSFSISYNGAFIIIIVNLTLNIMNVTCSVKSVPNHWLVLS